MSGPGLGKQALILSGGAVYAAYEVGVMKALFQGESPATDYQPPASTSSAGLRPGP
jgi:predicted acylesterase/phospholipase RssA